MSKNATDEHLDKTQDDSLAYAQAQNKERGDDPLDAIKQIRLEQLAVCRLKSAKELQARTEQPQNAENEKTAADD